MLEDVYKQIDCLKIQIGCVFRFERLKNGMSQFDLSLKFESNPTLIGRMERGEVIGGWDKVYLLANLLNIDLKEIFILKSRTDLLKIIKESRQLEKKLTSEKKKYYDQLEKRIKVLF
jgi:transcriptional regulator with XRE-family HTH domain